MIGRVVVIGAGQAGCVFASTLREKGFSGDLVLLGDEGEPPYQRPPLSKAFLKGEISAQALALKPQGFFADRRIDFRPDGCAAKVDRENRQVELATGERLSYDRLVFATGVRNRTVAVPCPATADVLSLRTRRDAEALKLRLRTARRVVVIGAGFIGMEFAAVASQAGHDVTVVELASRSMARAVSAPMSACMEARHREAGVRFAFNSGLEAFETGGGGRLEAVRLKDGRAVAADLALVAIGVLPATELAEAAGLDVKNGIVVDASLTTSDPAIHAIGDCASFPYSLQSGRRIRLESVQNACDQARFLAEAMMGGPARYAAAPWFWSDQYELKLQIAGIGDSGYITEVRGDPTTGRFAVASLSEGQLMALETLNQPREHMLARNELKRLIASA